MKVEAQKRRASLADPHLRLLSVWFLILNIAPTSLGMNNLYKQLNNFCKLKY